MLANESKRSEFCKFSSQIGSWLVCESETNLLGCCTGGDLEGQHENRFYLISGLPNNAEAGHGVDRCIQQLAKKGEQRLQRQ